MSDQTTQLAKAQWTPPIHPNPKTIYCSQNDMPSVKRLDSLGFQKPLEMLR